MLRSCQRCSRVAAESKKAGTGNCCRRAAYDSARAAFYESVDWALDLSAADFGGETSIDGIPLRLVRRDPETQVIVAADRLTTVDWRSAVPPTWGPGI